MFAERGFISGCPFADGWLNGVLLKGLYLPVYRLAVFVPPVIIYPFSAEQGVVRAPFGYASAVDYEYLGSVEI